MAGPFAFAWAGGAIQEQVNLVTSGNTHGGVVNMAVLVGDTQGAQIVNTVSTSGLEEGALYRVIEGDLIPPDCYFIYDTSELSGATGSLALTRSTSGNARSVNLQVMQAATVANVACTVQRDTNVVILPPDIDLPAGVYCIRGTGIGQVFFNPIYSGTSSGSEPQWLPVSSAYFVYDGSSGSVAMQYQVADPHYYDSVDMFGQPTQIVTYLVQQKPCMATTSGTFPYIISGLPDSDWYNISNIPDGVLSSLQTGLVYNISGNGLAVGTTFVAPVGGRDIEIDQPANASQIAAILTITGPRTPDAPFDPAVHNRFDADVLTVEIAQEEGGFATLTVSLRLPNPTIGLLAVGRNLWCWLSWDKAWTPGGSATPDLVPLFNGRLVGVPKLQANEVVSLEFLARPDDFTAQKQGLAQALAELPYYDPIWLSQANGAYSPDAVLEAYSRLWHIDRTTLAVGYSDMLEGEAGIITIGEDAAFYDAFSLSYGEPPLVAVTVSGTVTWQQQADGFLDVTRPIVQAFARQGSPRSDVFPKISSNIFTSPGDYSGLFNSHGGGGLISCLCGEGLKSSWPSPGTSIGGGWNLTTLNDGDGYPFCYIWDAVRPNGWYPAQVYNVNFASPLPPDSQAGNTQDQSNVNVYLNPTNQYKVGFPLNIYKIRMVLQFAADRRRTETITAVLAADVQRLLSDSAEGDREALDLTSEYVGQGVDPGGEVPIGDLASRSYFQSERGTRSFEYLLLAARAKLRARARAVEITFACDWGTALGINLRNSVTLFDRRLPGGSATGKVKSYRLTVADGRMLGNFTIACSVGRGDPATAQAGVNSYVDDEYVDPGYQVKTGAQTMLLPNELAYQTLDDFVVVDDGLNLRNLTVANAVNECTVTNGLKTQLDKLKPFQDQVGSSLGDPMNVIREFTTTVVLDMRPVAGAEFHTSFFPAVSGLALPRTIDLDADPDGIPAYWDVPIGGSGWDAGESLWDGSSA